MTRPKTVRFGKVFPHTSVIPKRATYIWKEVVPQKFWERQTRIAEWKREDAETLVRMLKPLEGQYVVLYGGGALMRDYHLARLDKVELDHPTYYGIYKPKDKYIVVAHLSKGKLKASTLSRDPFTPHLGSWKIAAIERSKYKRPKKKRKEREREAKKKTE